MLHDDGADHDGVDDDGGDEQRRRPLGRRMLAGALGTTVAVAGLAGVGALGIAGLGGLDVVTGTVPASAIGDDRPRPATPTEDPYLAGLTAEETAPPEGPDDRPPPVADVADPVVRVVPLAPGESYGQDADAHVVAYEMPDVGAVWSSALPAGQVLLGDLGQYRLQPSVPGQSCNGPGPEAVAGRQWSWAEENSNRLDQTSVDLVVTGWPEGSGPAAFDDVVEDDGACTWFDDVPAPADVAVPSADEAWAGLRSSPVDDESSILLGAARTGDLVVGVQVWNPPAGDHADLLGALLEASVVELRDADPGGAAG